MSKQDYTSEQGPSWWDIERTIDELEAEWGGKFTVTIERHRSPKTGKYLHVATNFRVMEEYPTGKIRCGKHTRWDRRDFKTVTAVIYSHLLHLDNWLTQRRDEAERQTGF